MIGLYIYIFVRDFVFLFSSCFFLFHFGLYTEKMYILALTNAALDGRSDTEETIRVFDDIFFEGVTN